MVLLNGLEPSTSPLPRGVLYRLSYSSIAALLTARVSGCNPHQKGSFNSIRTMRLVVSENSLGVKKLLLHVLMPPIGGVGRDMGCHRPDFETVLNGGIHGWIISPALGARMLAPRMRPRLSVTATTRPLLCIRHGHGHFRRAGFQPDGIDPRCSGLSLGHADMGKLGVSIGHPRYSPIINLCRQRNSMLRITMPA